MPTAKNEVKLKFGTKAEYTSATKNADTVYFITDTNQIYIGNKLVSSKAYSGSSVPMSQQYGKGDIYLYTPANGDPKIYVHNGVAFSIVAIPITDITANTNARHSHTNKETLDAISGTPVQVTSQTLTDAQKTQARTNIGALGKVVPNPTNDNDAANKAYVDSKIASGGVTVDSVLSDTSTNPVQNKVVKAAVDGKSSVTIKSWTADDVGGVDVTLASGTTYIIDSQSLEAIAQNIEAPDGKIIIELPSAILADNNGDSIIQEPTKLYLGYGYNAIGDRMIYVSKFNPTNLLGSEIIEFEFTYPYVQYSSGDVSGIGERMKVVNKINSNSTIDYAQVQILSNVTVSSKQKQMLFEA